MGVGPGLRFSVVIPAYNRARWVGEAVESALSQGRDDFEIIVVDDGSTDATPSILSRFAGRARVIRQDNAGVSVARNRGMEQARGEWIAFLDADDRWRPGHLDRLATIIACHPGAGLIYTDAMVIDEHGRALKIKRSPPPGPDPFQSLLLANTVTTSSAAVRRECLDRVGMFPPGVKSAEDLDLWLRLARAFPVAHLPEVSIDYRRQSGSTVNTRGIAMREDNLFVISRAAARAPNLPASVLKKARANAYRESAVRMLAAGQTGPARAELRSALHHNPWSPSAWGLTGLACLGPRIVRAVQALRQRRDQLKVDHDGRLRITHLITDSGAGGAEKILFELATRLDPRLYDCRVIALKRPGLTAARLAEAGISFRSLNLPASVGPGYMVRLPGAALKLMAELGRRPPPILHCWLFQANLLGRVVARVMGVPIVISGLRVIERERTFQDPLDRLTSGLVTRYLAVCEAVAAHYRDRLRLSPDRIAVIRNGIETEGMVSPDRTVLRRELGLSNDSLVIGSLGRLHRQKGFDLLIQAMPGLLARFPDLVLLIAGDGPERANLEQQVSSLHLGGHVRLLGAWSRVPEFLAALDVFVFPSRWEGMPNAVLEAMAAGVPVVAAAVGGVGEIMGTEAPAGVMVAPENAADLEAVVASLLSDPDRRARLGAEGRERVEREFRLDRMVESYERFYLFLLRERLAEKRSSGSEI